MNGSLGRVVESPFIIAVERSSLDIGRVILGVFFNVDQNRVAWGLLSGHCSGSGSSCVNSAGSGRGSKTSDSLVYIDVYVGFVNNFPVWSVILIICEIGYLLSNQFLDHIFKSNNTEGTMVRAGELRYQHHVRFALLEEVDDVQTAGLRARFDNCTERHIADGNPIFRVVGDECLDQKHANKVQVI